MRNNILRMAVLSCTLVFLGCDQVPSKINSSKSKMECNDSYTTASVIEALQDSINLDAKSYNSVFDTKAMESGIRATVSQLIMDISYVRTTQEDPQSTKNFCAGTLKVTIPVDIIEKANFTRQYHSEPHVAEAAYQEGFNLEANTITYALEYWVQPTDDGEFFFVDTQNGSDLSTFIATIVVDANQKSNVQKLKAIQSKAAAQAAIEAEEARNAAILQANNSIAATAAEQAKVKAEMDYKRSEFNKMWGRASKEAQNSIEYDQKDWVEWRDEVCVEEARSAEPARQEIVRMQCITRLLSDRYYEVKEYFDNY